MSREGRRWPWDGRALGACANPRAWRCGLLRAEHWWVHTRVRGDGMVGIACAEVAVESRGLAAVPREEGSGEESCPSPDTREAWWQDAESGNRGPSEPHRGKPHCSPAAVVLCSRRPSWERGLLLGPAAEGGVPCTCQLGGCTREGRRGAAPAPQSTTSSHCRPAQQRPVRVLP